MKIRLLILIPSLLLSACVGIYFTDAGTPSSIPSYSLKDWPYSEYWTGIIFNGAKIGFSHLSITAAIEEPEIFTVRSEAALRFRFLMLDKKVNITTDDWVNSDLTLKRFAYSYHLDGNTMHISGNVSGDRLETEIQTDSKHDTQTITLANRLYPTSAIALYPVLKGLEVGRHYEYQVYDGESQRVTTVTQKVIGYESSKLFEGRAYKIKTAMYGNKVTTWVNADGQPVLEMAMNGVLISGLESEALAKRYLTLASINKNETLLNFSLIQPDMSIAKPRAVTSLKIELTGIADSKYRLPDDTWQQCRHTKGSVICDIPPIHADKPRRSTRHNDRDVNRYLRPSITVPSSFPEISRQASDIVGTADTRLAQIEALVDWIQKNVQQEAVDVFSAADVLQKRKAECQGQSYLYAAFARSRDIPTRVVNGLVYSKQYNGFLYHTWTESWIGNTWLAIDPTFGQIGADATHIKLVEGENLADLAPLLPLIGRLQARILAIETLPDQN